MALLVSGILDFQNTATIINYPGGLQSQKFATTITTPSEQPIITHGLNSTDVHVQVYKIIPPGPNAGTRLVATGVRVVDANTVELQLTNDSPATFRVVVMV